MAQTIRVSLSGFNVLTDTNLDHYALYADSDNILIKEHSRGTSTQNNGVNVDINHNLGYVPFASVWYSIPALDANEWIWATSNRSSVSVDIKSDKITLNNASGFQVIFRYYIFYDQIV